MGFQLLVFSGFLNHTDIGAQSPQLVNDVLVAALDILHAADLAFTLGSQRGDDQRGTARRSQAWMGAPVR